MDRKLAADWEGGQQPGQRPSRTVGQPGSWAPPRPGTLVSRSTLTLGPPLLQGPMFERSRRRHLPLLIYLDMGSHVAQVGGLAFVGPPSCQALLAARRGAQQRLGATIGWGGTRLPPAAPLIAVWG